MRYAVAMAVCQIAAVCSATIVLAASPPAGGSIVESDEECRCEHSAAVMCPMHRKTSSRPVPADAPRWCTGVDDSAFAVLPAFGALALPERIAHVTRPADRRWRVHPTQRVPIGPASVVQHGDGGGRLARGAAGRAHTILSNFAANAAGGR